MGRPRRDGVPRFFCPNCTRYDAERVGTTEHPKTFHCKFCGHRFEERTRIRVRTPDLKMQLQDAINFYNQKRDRLIYLFGLDTVYWHLDETDDDDVRDYKLALAKLEEMFTGLAEERDGHFFAWQNCDRSLQAMYKVLDQQKKEQR